MKIIEGMREISALKSKINDLKNKIAANSAHVDIQPTEYKDDAGKKIQEWLQSCTDSTKRIVELKEAIARTNLLTNVTITLDEKDITRSITGWIARRMECANLDKEVYLALTDKRLKAEPYKKRSETGGEDENHWTKVILNYNPSLRDKKIAEYQSEPHRINAVLEVVNATTDLIFI